MELLTEGLRIGDLEDLVQPLMSIDEWESKVAGDAIVVGFFVEDEDPAWDLAKFIEKGALDLLDADVSPAPNEEGYYMVFVEYTRNEEFPANLQQTLESIEGLVGLEPKDFKFQGYKLEKKHPYSEDHVRTYIRLQKDEEMTESAREIADFLKESFLDDIDINGNEIMLEEGINRMSFDIVAFGKRTDVNRQMRLYEREVRLDGEAQAIDSQLQRALGNHWDIYTFNNSTYITRGNDSRAMVLRHKDD
jgi:hypothetical protein